MGARAALQHACMYPESWDALILISANPGIESAEARTERCEADSALASRIEACGLDAFLDYWQDTPMIRSQRRIRSDWRAAMQTSRAQHTVAGLARSLREFGQGSCPNLWPEFLNLTMPVLLITGAEDTKYTALSDRMRKHVTMRTIIDTAGHMPHLEQPEATAAAINRFLEAM